MSSELDRRMLLGAAGLAGVAAVAGAAKAGPLNPPAGAVASSGRTLDEIYNRIPSGGAGDGRTAIPGGTAVVTIAAAGSYVLTGDIVIGTAAARGIMITGGNVTLDLNGYSVRCTNAASTVAGIEIGLPANSGRVTVRNGSVTGFQDGILMSGSNIVIEDMLIDRTRFRGILPFNSAAHPAAVHVIRRCTVTNVGALTVAADVVDTIGIGGTIVPRMVVEDCTVLNTVHANAARVRFGITHAGGVTVMRRNIVQGASLGLQIDGPNSIYRDNSVRECTATYNVGAAINGGGNV